MIHLLPRNSLNRLRDNEQRHIGEYEHRNLSYIYTPDVHAGGISVEHTTLTYITGKNDKIHLPEQNDKAEYINSENRNYGGLTLENQYLNMDNKRRNTGFTAKQEYVTLKNKKVVENNSVSIENVMNEMYDNGNINFAMKKETPDMDNEVSDIKDNEDINSGANENTSEKKKTQCSMLMTKKSWESVLFYKIVELLQINSSLPWNLNDAYLNYVTQDKKGGNNDNSRDCYLEITGRKLNVHIQTLLNDRKENGILNEILLFIANCNPQEAVYLYINSQYTYHIFQPGICLTPEASQYNDTTDQFKLTMYEYDNMLFTSDICTTNHQTLMMLLYEMDDIASHTSTLGTQLKLTMETQFALRITNMQKYGEMIFEEIDGRVGRLVAYHKKNCIRSYNNDSNIYNYFAKGIINKITSHLESNSISAIVQVANRYSGFLKIIHKKHHGLLRFVNQGPAEVLAHYADAILGFYRTPTTVNRRILCKSINATSMLLEGMDIPSKKITDRYKNDTVYDAITKTYYVNVAIIASVKDIHFTLSPLIENANQHDELGKYFSHKNAYHDLLTQNILISPQRLRDISDIHISDYIVINEDRILPKNWVISGIRLFNFDNGAAFYDSRTGRQQIHTIKCIPIFCKYLHETELASQMQFCRFNPDTIKRLMSVGPLKPQNDRFGFVLQRFINNEVWNINIDEYTSKLSSPHYLDQRVENVLMLHDRCLQLYGKSIYI